MGTKDRTTTPTDPQAEEANALPAGFVDSATLPARGELDGLPAEALRAEAEAKAKAKARTLARGPIEYRDPPYPCGAPLPGQPRLDTSGLTFAAWAACLEAAQQDRHERLGYNPRRVLSCPVQDALTPSGWPLIPGPGEVVGVPAGQTCIATEGSTVVAAGGLVVIVGDHTVVIAAASARVVTARKTFGGVLVTDGLLASLVRGAGDEAAECEEDEHARHNLVIHAALTPVTDRSAHEVRSLDPLDPLDPDQRQGQRLGRSTLVRALYAVQTAAGAWPSSPSMALAITEALRALVEGERG